MLNQKANKYLLLRRIYTYKQICCLWQVVHNYSAAILRIQYKANICTSFTSNTYTFTMTATHNHYKQLENKYEDEI